jgi:hypothetical protein
MMRMMSARGRRSSKNSGVTTSQRTPGTAQHDKVRSLLKMRLVHTRDIPNGKDFLFLGPRDPLYDSLRSVLQFENRAKRLIHVDFAAVDEYFLLRMSGPESAQEIISTYFE